MPSAVATCGADAGRVLGVRRGRDDDAADLAGVDARRRQRPACGALIDIPMSVSPSPAKRRVRMPERVWIHSSVESSTSQISSLVTTRSGRWTPRPSIAAWVSSVGCWIVMTRA